MNENYNKIIERWQKYCEAQGLEEDACSAKLGIYTKDYHKMVRNLMEFPAWAINKMQSIIAGRDLLDQTVLQTSLLEDFEYYVERSFREKIMVTLSAPTGQGKTVAAKHLCNKHCAKYYTVLSEFEKSRYAARKALIKDMAKVFHLKSFDTGAPVLRNLINRLSSDERTLLVIDEAQRLISEDWGYFKIIQDIYDNCQNLSIIMIGNYSFYNSMYMDAKRTYSGVLDEEQFLRRMSTVHKLPRLSKKDVRIWADYNGIPIDSQDCEMLADYFKNRGALSDLENTRKEIIRVMGKGTKIKSWKDVDADRIIAMYKIIHSNNEPEGINEEIAEEARKKNVA